MGSRHFRPPGRRNRAVATRLTQVLKLHATRSRFGVNECASHRRSADMSRDYRLKSWNVAQPEHANVGASTLRHDNGSLPKRAQRCGWTCDAGLDPSKAATSLEQRMLAELRGRLAGPSDPPA
jgi:hypothetical protein